MLLGADPIMKIYQRLIRNVAYPLVLLRRGELAEARFLREFERTQFLGAHEIRALQWKRLRRLLDHAYRRCPFYKERFDAVGLVPSDLRSLEDLQALPVLEKKDIQDRRDALIASAWPEGDLLPNHTGGSTGRPLAFFLSRERKCARAAATVRHNRWAGWDIGDKVACLWGAPQDMPPHGWRTRLRAHFLDLQLMLDAGHLTERKLDEFAEALKRFRPRVILAYARAAVLLARYLRWQGRAAYQPQSIVTSAEVLEDDDRALVEEVFGCRVFNRYGCREVSVIASECSAHQGMHTMAEGLYVEVEHNAEQPGALGSILITDLLNYAMPLIRYRIGDVGSWETGACSCGRGLPRLARVAGRVTDFLVGTDGRLVSGIFLATYVVGKRPSLGQVQIHQESAGQVLFRIQAGAAFNAAEDLDYLRQAARRYLGEGAVVDHEFVEQLRPEKSGKFLFCRSTATPQYMGTQRSTTPVP
jgi:phenylacetate-CoA ligase